MEEPQTIWDKRYSQYNKTKSQYDNWLEPWQSLFVAGNIVLDVGCGRGYDTQYLISKGCQVIATDFSKAVLKMVRQNIAQAIVVQVDMRQGLPFLDQQFQAIIANLSLHYFPWEQTCRIISQIRDCLTENGKLLARFNSINDVNYGARGHSEPGGNYFLVNGEMKHFFDEETLAALFGIGWKIERMEEKELHRFGEPKVVWEVAVEKID